MRKSKLFLPALLLAVGLLLGACGEPVRNALPTEVTAEAAENHIGRRFNFTLDELSRRMDRTIASADEGSVLPVQMGDWEVLTQGLADDSGVKYTSYSMVLKGATLTAAVEDESAKLINVGCGCHTWQLEDELSREGFIALTAILAEQAGGFTDADLPFLRQLIAVLLSGEEDELYYEGILYSESVDDYTVVVILSPCSAEKAKQNSVKPYGSHD